MMKEMDLIYFYIYTPASMTKEAFLLNCYSHIKPKRGGNVKP